MVREISAGAVIFRKEGKKISYLLLHYHFKTDYWDFPKGKIETGEDEEDTVLREIKEETAIDGVKIFPDFKEKVSYFYRKNGETVFKEVVFYLAETNEKDVKISHEHTGYEWVGYDTALKRLKENSKKVLVKANKFLSKNLTKWM
ncbi:MAG: NUDIX domain-containing protein [Candidatus Aenigmarchaeota archaeon]|nr:NUDIX domain-containing protein [Candidatus Aenigmarchaeota archaeon]